MKNWTEKAEKVRASTVKMKWPINHDLCAWQLQQNVDQGMHPITVGYRCIEKNCVSKSPVLLVVYRSNIVSDCMVTR